MDLPPSFPSGHFGFYFKSTKEASKELFEALQDDSCYVIGLYGNRGSGKTTLVRAELNKYRQVFDRVLFPTVSQNQDIYNIQERIANKLDNVRFQSDDNETTRVVKLLSGLFETKGTTLVILDDFQRMYKPLEVGIPIRNKRYKVLLITRDKLDCISMGCDRWIPLNAFNNREAWVLLKYFSSLRPQICLPKVAQQVALKCNGLPGLIRDVVSSLYYKSTMDWEESLVSLSHLTARYQIFISFRGPDTRHKFAIPLYDSLCSAGFKTFIDDKSIEGGTLIEKLLEDIEESRFAIIIFSKNYAESKWCLRELEKILKCKDHTEKNQLVLPIFYDVPREDVRDVLNNYADAMTKHENNGEDLYTLKTWKKALHDVCRLQSFEKTHEWSRDELIGNIVKFACDQRHRLHIQSMYTGPSQTSGAEPMLLIPNPAVESTSSWKPKKEAPEESISSNNGFMYLSSTIKAQSDLRKALLDDSYHSIGLYGRRGVGKTALVNSEIPEYQKIFDQVLFVTVPISGNEDLPNLGGQIASQLNLSFGENLSNLERSIQVKATLENKKNILVIFDDFSTMFDPRDIGIPNPSKQCKLLWITRDKNKLTIRRCSPLIPLLPLSPEDAWKLLQQYSGIHDDGFSPEGLVNVAREVAVRCKGLPRVIQDVMSILPNKKTKESWTEALDSLNHVTATHQIFISFRGRDSRPFSETLYHALAREGFKVFFEAELVIGQETGETLFEAIEQSRASIVVLSQNYAQSRRCLRELLKIVECKGPNKQLVLPIFYEVDRNDVRCVKGPYKEAMDQNEKRYGEDEVHEWRSALQEVAHLPGKHYEAESSHDTFVQEIVEYFKQNRHRLHII